MALRYAWIVRLIGLSTDDKPTEVPNGSVFLEVNTDTKFIFYDGTWYEVTFCC